MDLKIEIENLKDDALKLRMHERYYRSGKQFEKELDRKMFIA